MTREIYDVNNTLIQLVMVLKTQQLKRGAIPALRYDDLEAYLARDLWRRSGPRSLHEATDQILSVQESQIIRFLSRQAIVDGAKGKLGDFKDLIEGN